LTARDDVIVAATGRLVPFRRFFHMELTGFAGDSMHIGLAKK
jgi:hypothetical protein